MKKVIIIGGGFAGVNLAMALAGRGDLELTLVDRNNYNFFPPLLYQVATAFLEPSSISYPYRKLFRGKRNTQFRIGELVGLDPWCKTVTLSTGKLSYDSLVIATGSETNYFGLENVRQKALPMKTINDSLRLRNQFLENLEQATSATDITELQKLLTIVIAGGGPTGVEISGMLSEMRHNIIPRDYPELIRYLDQIRIVLVDASPQLLSPMSDKSQEDAWNALDKMGVEILLSTQVTDYENDLVSFTNGKSIPTKTLVWAAGVSASTFEGIPEQCYGRGRRLVVDSFNQVMGLQNVYAIGDTCIQTTDNNFPSGHPQLAQVAIQQGNNLAKNFVRSISGKSAIPFTYVDRGTMAIMGTNKAVVDLQRPKIHLRGFPAWLAWVFVHLAALMTSGNRARTFYNWAGSYITRDQSLRMIFRP